MKSSRRVLLDDMAKHRTSLEKYPKYIYPRFSFTPKTAKELPPKTFRFYCDKPRVSQVRDHSQEMSGLEGEGGEYGLCGCQ